jgi:hypothetical protein
MFMRGGWGDPKKKMPGKRWRISAGLSQKGVGAGLTACHIAPVDARAGQ